MALSQLRMMLPDPLIHGRLKPRNLSQQLGCFVLRDHARHLVTQLVSLLPARIEKGRVPFEELWIGCFQSQEGVVVTPSMSSHAVPGRAHHHGRECACGLVRVTELPVKRNAVKTRVAEASLRDFSEFLEFLLPRGPSLDSSLLQQFLPSHPLSL